MKKLLVVLALLILVAGALTLVFRDRIFSPSALPPGQALEFQRRFRSGLELSRLYRLNRARADFEACVKIDPASAEAHFHLGRLWLIRGDLPAARTAFQKAVELAPDHGGIHRFLFDLYSGHPGLKDPGAAREHLRALRSLCGELVDYDISLRRKTERLQSTDAFGVAMRELRGMGGGPLKDLHAAFYPDGEDHAGARDAVAGVPGLPRFIELFERCPGLIMVREAVASQLVNPSRAGLPRATDERAPGSSIPLEMSQSLLEELFDFSELGTYDSFFHFSGLALVEMKMGDYRAAAARLGWLMRVKGPLGDMFRDQSALALAMCRYKLGELDEARELYRGVVERQPGRLDARWLLHLLGEGDRSWRSGEPPAELAGRFVFQERGAELGVDKYDAGGTSGWTDFDLDGDLDLFVSGCDTYSVLYRRERDGFVDASREAGLENVASGFSAAFADHDADGDDDLLIVRDGWAGAGSNSLWENRGDGSFADITERAGLAGSPVGSSFTCSWADFDRDGKLDVFVTNGVTLDGSTNRLYRSRGDGTYEDVTRASGLEEAPGVRSIGCAVGDYDQDGWTDIFVSGFEPTPNRLYRNRGDGTFEEVARRAGVDDRANVASGFVAFLADLDGDARPDIFMVKWEPSFHRVLASMRVGYVPDADDLRSSPRFFRNRGDGTFEDVSRAAGLVYPHGAMGAGLADLDNDGFLDIYLGNGGPALERLEPDSLYANIGGKRFVEIGRGVGMGHVGKGHGVSFADFDRDGDLDVYAPLGGAFHGDMWRNAFYVNETRGGFGWLQVLLRGTKSHRTGVGARVTARAGDLTVYREKGRGVGFGATDSPYLHFGLGPSSTVDSLVVQWLSGVVDSFESVPANRFIVIQEGKASWIEEKDAREEDS